MATYTASIEEFIEFDEEISSEKYTAGTLPRFGVAAYYTNGAQVVTDSGIFASIPGSSFDTGSKVFVLARADLNSFYDLTHYHIGLHKSSEISETVQDFHNPWGQDFEYTFFASYLEEDWDPSADFSVQANRIEAEGTLNIYEPSVLAIDLGKLIENKDYIYTKIDTPLTPNSAYPSQFYPHKIIDIPSTTLGARYLGIFWSKWTIADPNKGVKIGTNISVNHKVIAEDNCIRPIYSKLNSKFLGGIFVLEEEPGSISISHRSETGDTVDEYGIFILNTTTVAKDSEAVQKQSQIKLSSDSRPNNNLTHSASSVGNILVFEDFSFQVDDEDFSISVSSFLTLDDINLIGRSVSKLISPGSFSDVASKARSPRFRLVEDQHRVPLNFESFIGSRGPIDGHYYRKDAHLLTISQQLNDLQTEDIEFSSVDTVQVTFNIPVVENIEISDDTIVELGQRNQVFSEDDIEFSENSLVSISFNPILTENIEITDKTTYSFASYRGLSSDYTIGGTISYPSSSISSLNLIQKGNVDHTKEEESLWFIGIPKIFTIRGGEKYSTGLVEFWDKTLQASLTLNNAVATYYTNLSKFLTTGYISQYFTPPVSGAEIQNPFIWGIPISKLGVEGIDYFYDENTTHQTLNTKYSTDDKFIELFAPSYSSDPEPFLLLSFVTLQWDVDGAKSTVSIYNNLFEAEQGGLVNYIAGANEIDGNIFNTVTVPIVEIFNYPRPGIEELSIRAISSFVSSIEHLHSNALILRLAQFENYGYSESTDHKPILGTPLVLNETFAMTNAGDYIVIVTFQLRQDTPEGIIGLALDINGETVLDIPEYSIESGGLSTFHRSADQKGDSTETSTFLFIHKGYNPIPSFDGISPIIDCTLTVNSSSKYATVDINRARLIFFSERRFFNDAIENVSEEIELSEILTQTISIIPDAIENIEFEDVTPLTVQFLVDAVENLEIDDTSYETSNIFSFVEILEFEDVTESWERVHPIVDAFEYLEFSLDDQIIFKNGVSEDIEISENVVVTVKFAVGAEELIEVSDSIYTYQNPSISDEYITIEDATLVTFSPLIQTNLYDIIVKVK